MAATCDESCTCPMRESCLGRRHPEWGPVQRAHWDSGDPARRHHAERRSALPYLLPDPEASRPGAPPPPPPSAAQRAAAKEASAAWDARVADSKQRLVHLRSVRACPHWEATSECGCGMNRCKAGKGRPADGAVSLRDCVACLGLDGPTDRDRSEKELDP